MRFYQVHKVTGVPDGAGWVRVLGFGNRVRSENMYIDCTSMLTEDKCRILLIYLVDWDKSCNFTAHRTPRGSYLVDIE
jgi:hypothetical protein